MLIFGHLLLDKRVLSSFRFFFQHVESFFQAFLAIFEFLLLRQFRVPKDVQDAVAPEDPVTADPLEISVRFVTWMTGMPARSISFVITAPQREDVPHVLVRMTASTSCLRKSAAISLPNFLPISIGVITPAVV